MGNGNTWEGVQVRADEYCLGALKGMYDTDRWHSWVLHGEPKAHGC